MRQVQYLRSENINDKAEEVLSFFDPRWRHKVTSPIHLVVQGFKDKYGIPFYFDQVLGHTPQGTKVLGLFYFKSREIFIDQSLPENSPRWRFVIAHEIGHLVLHRKINPKAIKQAPDKIIDTRRQIRVHQKRSESDWLEWQANEFAAALLLPRTVLQLVIAEIQQEIGTRVTGSISSWTDSHATSKLISKRWRNYN